VGYSDFDFEEIVGMRQTDDGAQHFLWLTHAYLRYDTKEEFNVDSKDECQFIVKMVTNLIK